MKGMKGSEGHTGWHFATDGPTYRHRREEASEKAEGHHCVDIGADTGEEEKEHVHEEDNHHHLLGAEAVAQVAKVLAADSHADVLARDDRAEPDDVRLLLIDEVRDQREDGPEAEVVDECADEARPLRQSKKCTR